MRRVGLIIYDVYCLIKMRARACQKKCWVVGLLFTDYRHYFFLSDPIKVFLKNLSLNMYPELVSAWACLSFRQLGIVSFLCPFCILSVSFLHPMSYPRSLTPHAWDSQIATAYSAGWLRRWLIPWRLAVGRLVYTPHLIHPAVFSGGMKRYRWVFSPLLANLIGRQGESRIFTWILCAVLRQHTLGRDKQKLIWPIFQTSVRHGWEWFVWLRITTG